MTIGSEEYERAKQEGRMEARVDEAFVRLNKINGSVERHAKSNETLAKEMKAGFEAIAAEIRNMQEEARQRELAVKVAAQTLANETERRRVEEERLRTERAEALEVPVRKWGIRANKATVILGVITLIMTGLAIYLGTR